MLEWHPRQRFEHKRIAIEQSLEQLIWDFIDHPQGLSAGVSIIEECVATTKIKQSLADFAKRICSIISRSTD
jgi:hypothetical protein